MTVADTRDAGYTLVEVVTASVVAGVVVLVAFSAYLAASRALADWERARVLDADALAVATALARDAVRAEAVTLTRDTLRFDGDRTVVYAARDSALVRAGVPMLDPSVRLADFTVETAEGPDERALTTVRFALTSGGRTVERRVAHARRGPAPWPEP